MNLRRLVFTSLAGLFALVASAQTTLAQPALAERKAAAQALFDDARKLTAEGRFAEACPKFQESDRLDSSMGTKFYLADCLEHVGRFASAWTYYVEVTDAARASGMKERESYARERADALLPRLGKLTVSVSEEARSIPGLEIRRDGLLLGAAVWGTAVPVDPGEHVITASATGREPWETRIDLKEPGQTLTVEVPQLKAAPESSTPPLKPIEDHGPPSDVPPPPVDSTRRTLGFVVGAAGVAGIGLGAFFGVRAISKKGESNENGHCDAQNFCDDAGLALRKEGISAATISTVGFVAGGVALAGGALLVITAPRSAPQGAQATPSIAVGPGTLSASWRW